MVIAFDVTRGRLIMRDRKIPALLPRTTKTLLCKKFSARENVAIAVKPLGASPSPGRLMPLRLTSPRSRRQWRDPERFSSLLACTPISRCLMLDGGVALALNSLAIHDRTGRVPRLLKLSSRGMFCAPGYDRPKRSSGSRTTPLTIRASCSLYRPWFPNRVPLRRSA